MPMAVRNHNYYDGGEVRICTLADSAPRQNIDEVRGMMWCENCDRLVKSEWKFYDANQGTFRDSIDNEGYWYSSPTSDYYWGRETGAIENDDYNHCSGDIMKTYFKFESDESNTIFRWKYNPYMIPNCGPYVE
jgi:hypothetical protein